MRVALVSEHASPLAVLGGVDAGGQNVHVAALAAGLARRGVEVVVHTRRDDPGVAAEVQLCPGVVVDHVDAGPPRPIAKDELLWCTWMSSRRCWASGQHDRAAVLQALECVDAVLVFDQDTPVAALGRLRPDLWVKGGDYADQQLPEADALQRWDGRVVVVPTLHGHSTTRLLKETTTRATG